MGCRSSRLEDATPAVVLCRERRDLLLAAADRRAALASAHSAYFAALSRVGDALVRFVDDNLTCPPPRQQQQQQQSQPPESPVLTLPTSDSKRKSNASSLSNSNSGGSGGSHLHCHSHSDPDLDDDELHEITPNMVEEEEEVEMQQNGNNFWNYTASYPQFPPNFGIPNYNYHYMKSNSAAPNTVYEQPYQNINNVAYNYEFNNPMYGYYLPPEQDKVAERMQKEMQPPPPPPPPPESSVSAWDFFNPFDSYQHNLPEYDRKSYGVASVISSMDSSEVREREGIPELEEETEQESMREGLKARKAAFEAKKIVGGNGSLNSSLRKRDDEVAVESVVDSEKESQCSCECSYVSSNVSVEEETEMERKVKRVSIEDGPSLVTSASVKVKGSALSVHGTRDVVEVVEEIKEQFNSAASFGEEVARILEVGNLRYRSRNRILQLILSRILGRMAVLFSTLSQPPGSSSEHAMTTTLKITKPKHQNPKKVDDMELNSLSSIMDRLYVWEKRLHKEVKEEEKLRIIYDQEWKHLKALDDAGAEASKIDSTRASIRSLLTKLNVAIRSVRVISSRIHKLRDDELQPHLIELIQGLVRMWKFVLECHRKQFKAIVEAKSHSLVPKIGAEGNSSKATIQLEIELLNWCSCFRDWIMSQKAYIEALNGWLMRWLPREKEETPDGIAPFSPGRIGAPAVFITANDWHNTMERISSGGVIDAMQAFTISVHRLWEKQDEEQEHKLKADNLSRDFAKMLKALQKENGVHGHLDMDKTALSLTGSDGPIGDDQTVALDALRKRLDGERAKHEEAIKDVEDANASDLKAGLGPIFEALESFTSETLKAYENVRIPNVSGVT